MKPGNNFFVALIMCAAITSRAQVADGFSYQVVLRGSDGAVLANETVSLRFTLYSSPVGGEPLTVQYVEIHDANTNEFGLVNLVIGNGQPIQGNMGTLVYGWPEYHLKTELDLGNGWVDMGTQQLQSVPFAQRADYANSLDYPVWKGYGNDDANTTYYFVGTTNDVGLPFRTNNVERVYFTSTGNVGINTHTPSWLLTVNGLAAKPGGGSWTATSDARLKQDVHPFTEGLDELMKIDPVTYHYIEQTGHDTKVEYVGVIAQDLQKVSPSMVNELEMELVDGSKGNYLSVDPSAFTYMLINGMKDQQAQIDELKRLVLAQQQQINTLQLQLTSK